jgi:hypothetical protein
MTQVVEYQNSLTLSELLAKSNILPSLGKGAKYTQHDIFVLSMIGQRLGIDPIASVMGIYIVEGRPMVSSRLVRGLILKNGHKFEIKEWTAQKISVLAARGTGEPVEFTYTIAEAAHAGLTNKNTWKSHPRRMLLAAVTRNVADALFADLFLGLVNDDGSDPGADGSAEVTSAAVRPETATTITLESLGEAVND